MFKFVTFDFDSKKYLAKDYRDTLEGLAVLHKNKYRSSINLPKLNEEIVSSINPNELTKTDVEKMGYVTSKNHSFQVVNSDIRIDTSFLFEDQSYVENLDILKTLLETCSDKNKGLIIFENESKISKHLKSKGIPFSFYNKSNINIKYSDLNEWILLDVLDLSNREQSVIASFINFKASNKGNEKIDIPVLKGNNWLYDLFIVEPSTLAQQFKVNEYAVKTLKTSMLKIKDNGMMSDEFSNINELIQKANNGEIVVIDVKDQDKKLLKAVIDNVAKEKVIVADNIYQKCNNIQYLLYDSSFISKVTKDFKSFVFNRNSLPLKEDIISMQYYKDELKFLDFEYILVKENAFPILITNEDYIKNKVKEGIKVLNSSTSSFF